MGKIEELLLEEARQSFFQLENLACSADDKAFGLIAFDAILITISGYFLDITDQIYWYIPPIFLSASLIIALFCAYPCERYRQDPLKAIQRYGEKTSEEAAAQLAVNYATFYDELKETYNSKFSWLVIGFQLTLIGAALMIILLYSSP